ncbi:MAG TPA: hypothetical protein VEL80_00805 [Burkholderiales bacterium]|nr:hypothetical protein [Burkholderiales bacterium]
MKHQPELVRVAASPKFMLNGVAVSPRGRVFASFPRWTSLAAPSVMEAMPDGSFEPYPGDAWNEWRPEAAARDRIVSSHAVFADPRNNLWVVDDAAPRVAPPIEGAAKLVKFDLDTDRVSRVYPLGGGILSKGAMIGRVPSSKQAMRDLQDLAARVEAERMSRGFADAALWARIASSTFHKRGGDEQQAAGNCPGNGCDDRGGARGPAGVLYWR